MISIRKEACIRCPDCKDVKTKKDLILKMGGIICGECRVILAQAYSDSWYELTDNPARSPNGIKVENINPYSKVQMKEEDLIPTEVEMREKLLKSV